MVRSKARSQRDLAKAGQSGDGKADVGREGSSVGSADLADLSGSTGSTAVAGGGEVIVAGLHAGFAAFAADEKGEGGRGESCCFAAEGQAADGAGGWD